MPNVTSDVEATDNCTPTELLVITQSPAAGTLVGTGTTTITVTVRDASNNSSTCTTTFTLLEFTPPTALCKPYTAVLDGTGHASITAANVDNGSTDNCAIATRTVTPSTFTCANKGSNTVTLTVTDPSGNSSHCTTTVTVVDNTPPTITCPANVTKNNDLGLCSAIVSYPNATATDNCSGVGTPVCSPASGTTFPKGTTTVTCTVSDASGNPASCSFSVTVIDAQPPAISCPADITLEPTCPSGAIATYTAPVGTDNCPNATTARTAGPASGSVFPIGNTTVTYTVTDAVGLTASCSFTVKVKTAAATIQDMIARVNLLVNQGKLTGQQGQGLNSKLQAALDAVNNGQTNVACNKLNDFISQVTAYINNGTLTSADGQPLITSAAHVRNTLGCTSLGCS
ncbi:MAG TPA: HYR domain-containing protein [Blastocatellia bacterium]|nr:HYR domain-containing protein [Blastocatellia bacterium]